MSKNLKGAQNDLDAMRLETDYIVQKESNVVMENMELHTKNLEEQQRLQAYCLRIPPRSACSSHRWLDGWQDRANSSLEIMQASCRCLPHLHCELHCGWGCR